ncbi:hypothetical protein [Mycobacterium tuberculosis]|uniref:hypothetical protein n=1 Tax=Mycobacterium tuberculosis TaxID=1773 RepID=UPI00111526FE|nr:hypothetical protein [Mycobacterium tuberculosis]
MRGLPERAKGLRKEAEELFQQRLESEKQASGFNMGEKLESSTSSTNVRRRTPVGANPFTKKPQNEVAVSSEEVSQVKRKNPFRKQL